MNINEIKNEQVSYIDHFDIDGIEYGRSLFNLEWITAVTESPKVIFDIGCYDCGDSIRFKRRFPNCEIYSFEASPQRHFKLRETARKYNLNLVPLAVSDKVGTTTFYNSLVDNQRIDAQGSFFKHADIYKATNPRIIQESNGIAVQTTTVEAFCVTSQITQIDLLYVDVEGAELQVIKGLGTLKPKMVFVETLDFSNASKEPMWQGEATNSHELEQYLFSLGYVLIKVLDADRLYFHNTVI